MHGEFKKANSYRTLQALVNGKVIGSVIDMQDENEVSALKRAVGSAFALKNLLDYEPDVDHTLERLVQAMRKRRTVSLLDAMQQFQVDFLMKAAFSKDTDYLETNRSTNPISTDARLQHWYQWQSMPGLEWLLFKSPLCSAWYGGGRTKPQVWTTMALDETQRRQRLKSGEAGGFGSKKPDLLSKYLCGWDRHKETVSETTMVRMVSSTIAAGFDTSAYTMTMILYNLLKHPAALKKLRSELDNALNSGRLSDPPTFSETDKLDYLGAVIKETMRLQPFVKPLLERIVPPGGADIAGKFLPGGTTVAISSNVAHNDIPVFGKDAEEFRPDRWLEGDHQHKLLMERSVLGFGAGKRVCIGRHIAELEMKKVIPRLLLEFDVSPPVPSVQ
jgi:cytochrome P450